MKTTKKLGSIKFTVGAIAFAAVVTLMPQKAANAGLKEAMNEMFLTTSTSPQALQSQRLRGVYGGSLSVRSPGRSINIVQFAPPRIDAGCGGVDIFFGSFSFINGAQFEQLMRTIAANAVGFAIKAAIKGMCQPCDEILQDLQDAMNALNAMSKNTCAIANSLVTGQMDEKLKEQGRRFGNAIRSATGRVADAVAGENKSFTERPSETAKADSESAADHNPVLGNHVWRAAKETFPNGFNTMRAFMTEREAIRFVMSLFGTIVVSSPDPGAQCGDADPQRCDMPTLQFYPVVSWEQIFKPRANTPNGIELWACQNESQGCTKLKTEVLPLVQWGGIEDNINIALFGSTTPENRSTWLPNSLIGSYALKQPLGSGNNLDARSKRLIDLIPLPIVNMLNETQRIGGAAEDMGLMLSRMLPDYFAYQLGQEILQLGRNTFTAQSKVPMPDFYRAALEAEAQKLMKYRPDAVQFNAMMTGVYESMKRSQTLTSSQARGAGGNGGSN